MVLYYFLIQSFICVHFKLFFYFQVEIILISFPRTEFFPFLTFCILCRCYIWRYKITSSKWNSRDFLVVSQKEINQYYHQWCRRINFTVSYQYNIFVKLPILKTKSISFKYVKPHISFHSLILLSCNFSLSLSLSLFWNQDSENRAKNK